ncbi:MAG TPA: cyclase family protein [Acidimicrobiales bacterium]|nr:cyclase family protein [Acidimicrobiales bacterium]
MDRNSLPSYDDLPAVAGAPSGSSWGVWGEGDVLGCLNLLTDERVRAGVGCAERGSVFNVNLELELPGPPLFGRSAFTHLVHDFPLGHDDELSGWNTQSSSQWDGFRHMKHPVYGHYNAVADEEHGIQHWARRGIVGRAVLADVARWRASVGRPLEPGGPSAIEIDDLMATLEAQGVTIEVGDILLLRTGWVGWYRGLGDAERTALAGPEPMAACGLQRGVETAKALWNLHIAAIAADNPALEVMPFGFGGGDEVRYWKDDPGRAAETMLHFSLLGLLGLPIGELFDFDALAEDCAGDGRYSCLFTSAPLNLSAGVASPPNALAIK